MSSTLCEIVYDGAKYAAAHMRDGVNFEGVVFSTGKPRTVSAELAGAALANYPEGFTLISGTPASWSESVATVKAAASLAADRLAGIAADDPTAAIKMVPVLTSAARKAIADGKGAEYIAAKKADKELPILVLVAHMLGEKALVAAAIGRAQALARGE